MSQPEHPTESDRQPGRWSSLLRRRIVFIPALAVIAIAPWLIPWGRAFEAAPAPQPVSAVERAKELQPSASASATPQGPDDQSVKRLAQDVANGGKGGYDVPVSPREVAAVSTVPGPYQRLGQIQIPKIGLDVSFGEGVFDKTLVKGPGHWPGTPMPGREGNSVISGHRNTHTQPFKELDELKSGDEITVTYGKDKPVTYKVTGTTIVPQEKYKDFVLRQPDKAGTRQLTLFACHPEGNPIFRIVVQASASDTAS